MGEWRERTDHRRRRWGEVLEGDQVGRERRVELQENDVRRGKQERAGSFEGCGWSG